jgi:hypothetical protein
MTVWASIQIDRSKKACLDNGRNTIVAKVLVLVEAPVPVDPVLVAPWVIDCDREHGG